MPRPKRTKQEQIEDRFCEMTDIQQQQCLRDLGKLHGWCRKLRGPAQLDTSEPVSVQMKMEAE